MNATTTTQEITNALARAIAAHFDPEGQQEEARQLVEFLQRITPSRRYQKTRHAERDADLLDAIASQLDGMLTH